MVYYQNGDVLIMVFAAVVQRLSFRYACATLAGLFVVQMCFVAGLQDTTLRLLAYNGLFFFTAATLLIWAVYALESAERRNYLLNLRNRLLHDQLDKASKQDALIGLWNRRHLETTMAAAWAAAHRPRDVSVILLDIDHFKAFNDSYGHLKGDKCLRRVAGCVRDALAGEPRGCAVRFGGEEFLVFLDDVGARAVRHTAERIAAALKAAAIPHPVLGDGRIVTASLGVATGSAPALAMSKLIAAADDALYVAKRAGRDTISAASVCPEGPPAETIPLLRAG